MRSILAVTILSCMVFGCGARQERVQVEYLTSRATSSLPFSEAVRVGDVLYLSGVIATGADGKLVEGGIERQTEQVMRNIRLTLKRHGSSMDRVIKCTVMMADMREWQAMNAVYVSYFDDGLPARSAFGAGSLALGAKLEVECMAALD